MSRPTPLERAVLDALAWELREVAPDLGGQVEETLASVRRNTGVGAVTELIVARDRPLPTAGPRRPVRHGPRHGRRSS